MCLVKLGLVAHARATAEPGWESERARIESKLRGDGGSHLVVVRYRPDHNLHDEWVYNSAAIDEAPVVWAREMNATRMERLFRRFRGRRLWLVDVDEEPPRLVPFAPRPAP
jgi:hypothetical protein